MENFKQWRINHQFRSLLRCVSFMAFMTFELNVIMSCSNYDDTQVWEKLQDHEDRVTALERLCGEMNSNISSIQGILNASASGDYITDVSSMVVNGESVGYQITFKSADPIVIYHGEDGAPGASGADGSNGANGVDGANGKDGVTPEIGVKADKDGKLYWTLNGDWLLDDSGNKVQAEGRDGQAGAQGPQGEQGEQGDPGSQGAVGVTPRLKIEDGYWYVSYDNSATWSQLGVATGSAGAAGDSMFTSIDVSNSDFVIFRLSNGSEFKIPTWSAFEALLTTCNQMNTNISSISSLVDALNSRDYIVSVTPLMENRVEVGYTITFANSNPINIYHGTDGSNGATPVIGVKKHSDGVYYWTLDGSWLLDDNGNKVQAEGRDGEDGQDGVQGSQGDKGDQGEQGIQGPQGVQGEQGIQGPQGASGVTPKLKIQSGYWYVSYDNGSSWQQLDRATGEEGDSIFSGVRQDSDNVYFTLSNGTVITIPKCNCSNGGNSGGTGSGSTGEITNGLTINWAADATAEQKSVLTNLVNNMVLVEGGTFQMGSDSYSFEQPIHQVTLTNDYYMGKFEVTQEEWVAVMGENPSYFSGTNLPVEKVSWNDIVNDFLPELNRLTGLTFRLPTEAEWEYAARGGNKSNGYEYSGSNTIDDVAWRDNNSGDNTHSVGTKQANELGLYDMSGNVWERCSDWYGAYSSSLSQTNPTGPATGSVRVLRGGSWNDSAGGCRVSARISSVPDYRGSNYGFRLALSDSNGNVGDNDSSDDDSVIGGTTETIGGLTINWAADATAEHKSVLTNLVNNMVLVEGGTFMMGSDDSDSSDSSSDEQPIHQVTLTNDYYMGKFEVTQDEWVAVMGSNPSSHIGTNLPVENVSWNDIVNDFLPELNRLTGLTFRLPTEAEWEFAARGGNKSKGYKYSGSYTIDDVAWYYYNSDYKTHSVGTKQANELGLYDMSGNVYEWCSDWYGDYSSSSQTNPTGPATGSGRVLRGRSWSSDARDCRVSNRDFCIPGIRNSSHGFRLALSDSNGNVGDNDSSDDDSSDDDSVIGGATETIGSLTITWSSDATAEQKSVLTNLVNNMVLVEGGTFMMGSDDSDPYSNEKPIHQVTLTNDYYMGKFEVTQKEWVAVMGSNPSYYRGTNLPVDQVSWNDIVYDFLPVLNRLTGLTFRLPTEAEWEYAARGGNRSQGYKYSGSNNIDDVAWYYDNSSIKTHPVGTKQANELGLYDMSGNVWEWCSDWYNSSYYSSSPTTNPTGPATGSYRVFRGGGWVYGARDCRVSGRDCISPDNWGDCGGFRLAL